MTESLAVQSEIYKLSELLRVDPNDLNYLTETPSRDIATLRTQVTNFLFEGYDQRYRTLVALGRYVPAGMSAAIAQRVLDPMLAAQVTNLLEPGRASALARRLAPGYLAEVARHLNPRKIQPILTRMPCNVVGTIAIQLSQRRDYVTMGRFVAHLPERTIASTFACLPDIALLRTAFVLEGKDRLEEILQMVAPERMVGIINAARDSDLWPQTLDVMSHLAPDTQSRLANMAVADARTLASLTRACETHQTWDAIIPLIPRLSETNRVRIANETAKLSDTSLAAIIATVDAQNLWGDWVPFVADSMADEDRHRLGTLLVTAPGDIFQNFVTAVDRENLWSSALGTSPGLKPAERQRTAEAFLGHEGARRLVHMIEAADRDDRWGPALALIVALTPETAAELAQAAAGVSAALARTALEQAETFGLTASLGAVGDGLGLAAQG